MTITASEFKAKCLSLMEHVRNSGESISITKRGVEVARLAPPIPIQKPWERLRGTGKLLAAPGESFFSDSDFDAFTGRDLRDREAKRSSRKKR
ncbi:MAG: type II toxin-antitoxin system Phd/YefM family antitoxin [Spartobacteria bacterium]